MIYPDVQGEFPTAYLEIYCLTKALATHQTLYGTNFCASHFRVLR